jgi:hypothetical protein
MHATCPASSNLDELLAQFTGEAVIFTPGLAEAFAEQGEDIFSPSEGLFPFVAIARVDEDSDAIEGLIARLQEAVESEIDPEHQSEWITREFSDVEIHIDQRQTEEGPREQLSWAVFDGLLALSSEPRLLERVIRDVGQGGVAEPLAGSPTYETVDRFTSASDIWWFYDLERLMPVVRTTMREQMSSNQATMFPVDPDALFDALGLDSLLAAFLGLALRADGLSLEMGITHTQNRGLVKVMAYGPGDAPRPDFIPTEFESFGTASFDFAASWGAVEEIVNGINPALLAMASAQVNAMIQNAGVELDLRRDLLENLGGEIVMGQVTPASSTAAEGLQALFEQSQVLALSIRQRQSFELALETLKTMAGQGSELFEERDYLGTTIYSLKLGDAAGAVGYALTGDHFLLSFGPATALESMLVSMANPGESAWKLTSVRRAVSGLPAGAAAISYQDMAVTGHAAFEALAQLAGMDPSDESAICDPEEVPDQELIASYLGPAVSGVYKEEKSLIVRVKALPAQGQAE